MTEEIPGGDVGTFDLHDIIHAYTSDVDIQMITYKQNGQWLVKNMDLVVKVFNDSLDINREEIMTQFHNPTD